MENKIKLYEKLLKVQRELKCAKNQKNKFGNYNYRSAEDILEAVKPVLEKNKALMYLSDNIITIGERYYVEAIAYFIDIETGEFITNSASAREEESKKGMDGSQVTGASSSYARKYALNGMLMIDDMKDSDGTNENGDNPKENKTKTITKEQKEKFKELGISEKDACTYCKVETIDEIAEATAKAMINAKEKQNKK